MAKTPRYETMYSESPTVKKDADGKPQVTKAEKKAAEVDSGTDGIQQHTEAVQNLHMKHSKERLELMQKHEKEHMALMHKGMKESATDGTGGKNEISKIESDKKE